MCGKLLSKSVENKGKNLPAGSESLFLRSGQPLNGSTFQPVFSHAGQRLLFVLSDFANERLIPGLFVPGRAENHFREDRSKIDAFCGQPVNQFSLI